MLDNTGKGEKFEYQPDFDPNEDKPENPFAVLKKVVSDK